MMVKSELRLGFLMCTQREKNTTQNGHKYTKSPHIIKLKKNL